MVCRDAARWLTPTDLDNLKQIIAKLE